MEAQAHERKDAFVLFTSIFLPRRSHDPPDTHNHHKQDPDLPIMAATAMWVCSSDRAASGGCSGAHGVRSDEIAALTSGSRPALLQIPQEEEEERRDSPSPPPQPPDMGKAPQQMRRRRRLRRGAFELMAHGEDQLAAAMLPDAQVETPVREIDGRDEFVWELQDAAASSASALRPR